MSDSHRMRGALAAWGGGPFVIAHRGASGYLPEHTLEAYTLAIAQGADFIEPDVVATGDGHLICLHDVQLERATDVRTVYPERARADGRWYALDFTLQELRALNVHGGDRHRLGGCRLATLDEALGLVEHLNARLGRAVGVAPELKQPTFHRDAGQPLEASFARLVAARGYDHADARCIVQCFEAGALQQLRDELGCPLPNLFLLGKEAPHAAQLDGITRFADAIGPHRDAITRGDGALVRAAHERGLGVIPYTFAAEPDALRAFFHGYGVDALFTDFPDVAVNARDKP